MKLYLKRFSDLPLQHLYHILALRNNIFIVEQSCAFQDIDGLDLLAFHLYLEEKNNLIGYLRMTPLKKDFTSISFSRFCIAPTYRNKNLANDLLHFALEQTDKQWKSKEIKLSAQSHLAPFYKKHGFSEISEEYFEDHLPHIDMIRIKS